MAGKLTIQALMEQKSAEEEEWRQRHFEVMQQLDRELGYLDQIIRGRTRKARRKPTILERIFGLVG